MSDLSPEAFRQFTQDKQRNKARYNAQGAQRYYHVHYSEEDLREVERTELEQYYEDLYQREGDGWEAQGQQEEWTPPASSW